MVNNINYPKTGEKIPPLLRVQSLGGIENQHRYYMAALPNSQLELTTMLARVDMDDLKAPEKLIVLVLSTYGNNKGENIYPSLTTLAKKCSMSRPSLVANLKKLVDKGYIGVKSGGVVNGQNVTNQYMINLEKIGYDYGNVIKIS